MFNQKLGKVLDVNETIQKIIDANAEKYYLSIDINKNGSVSVFIGTSKHEENVDEKGE